MKYVRRIWRAAQYPFLAACLLLPLIWFLSGYVEAWGHATSSGLNVHLRGGTLTVCWGKYGWTRWGGFYNTGRFERLGLRWPQYLTPRASGSVVVSGAKPPIQTVQGPTLGSGNTNPWLQPLPGTTMNVPAAPAGRILVLPPGQQLAYGYTHVAVIPLLTPSLLLAPPAVFLLWRRLRRVPPNHCRNCRYNLTGNTSGICPECGTGTAGESDTTAQTGVE